MADEQKSGTASDRPSDQQQNGIQGGGTQLGGGPEPSDMGSPGGSSGTGGYGNAQNQQFHQGQQERPAQSGDGNLSRGERFDEAQGGGRGPDQIGSDADEFADDQAEHQDRGQSVTDAESDLR